MAKKKSNSSSSTRSTKKGTSTHEELETSREEIPAGMRELARAKSDLQNLLDSTQIATVFLDDNLCVRGFTPAISEIYRLEESDIGRPIKLFVPEVNDMPALPEPANVTDEINDTVEAYSGKTFVRRVLPYRTSDGDREGIVVTFIDVSESRQRELELAKAKSRLELALQVGEVATWSLDTRLSEVVTDKSVKRMFGFSETENVSTEEFFSRIHETHRSRVRDALASAVNSGEPFDEEYSIGLPTGETRWVRSRGKASEFKNGLSQDYFGVIIDITEHKNWEIKISQSEERMRLAAYAAKFATYDIDLIKDFIIWTPELADILGQKLESLAEARASQLVEFLHDDDRENWHQAVNSSYQTDGAGRLECEFRVTESDGSSRWVLGRGETIFEGEGAGKKAVRAVGVLMDINERKNTERQMKLVESERDESAMRLSMALRSGGMATWEWTPRESFWSKERYELLGISTDVNSIA